MRCGGWAEVPLFLGRCHRNGGSKSPPRDAAPLRAAVVSPSLVPPPSDETEEGGGEGGRDGCMDKGRIEGGREGEKGEDMEE